MDRGTWWATVHGVAQSQTHSETKHTAHTSPKRKERKKGRKNGGKRERREGGNRRKEGGREREIKLELSLRVHIPRNCTENSKKPNKVHSVCHQWEYYNSYRPSDKVVINKK